MTDEKKLETEYLDKEFKEEAGKLVVSAGYDASNVVLEADTKKDAVSSSHKHRKLINSLIRDMSLDEGVDEVEMESEPPSLLPKSILVPGSIDLEELERRVKSDYDDDDPNVTVSERSVDEEYDEATISPCSMKVLTGAGLDTFKGYLMDMGVSSNHARFRILFPREIGIGFFKLYQAKIPNNAGKSEMKSLKKALGLTKRRKKIQNIKERKTLQKFTTIGVRVIEVIVNDASMTKTRFKSPWTKMIYGGKSYPDWKVHEATIDAAHFKHRPTNEKMVIVEVNCTV